MARNSPGCVRVPTGKVLPGTRRDRDYSRLSGNVGQTRLAPAATQTRPSRRFASGARATGPTFGRPHPESPVMADSNSSEPPATGHRTGAPVAHRESSEEAISRLESDLEKLRALLREHLVQREGVEEELRSSGEQYRMLAESMEDMVSLHAEDGSVLYISPSSMRLTGIPPHEYLRGEPWAFIHPEDRDICIKGALPAVLRGESPTIEVRALCEDGGFRWVEIRARLVPAEGRTPRRVLCVSRDVEQRHKAEDALRRSE